MTKEQRSAWRKANPEKHRAEQRKHYAHNVRKIQIRQLKYRHTHPEGVKQDSHRRRARELNSEGNFTGKQWLKLCKAFKFRCLCCNKKRKLTADHVVPVSKGGSTWITNIQPLCGPCNTSKGNRRSTDYRLFPKWKAIFKGLLKRKWFCSESKTCRYVNS